MSDFDVEKRIEDLLLRYNTQAVPGWALRDYLRQELRAAESRALAQAAELCAARAWRWHQDSSAHRELLSCAAAIRGLSEPPD